VITLSIRVGRMGCGRSAVVAFHRRRRRASDDINTLQAAPCVAAREAHKMSHTLRDKTNVCSGLSAAKGNVAQPAPQGGAL